MKKKCLVVFGTRPEAIKMSTLALKLMNEKYFNTKICVTGQHREMLDQVLSFFKIKPNYDLNLMTISQSLNALSSRILNKLNSVYDDFQPDIVLVHGDTTTAMIGALAAFHKGIKIGHIEAGLRTYNKFSPFPEEINRQIVGKLSDYHFSPTSLSRDNLIKENIDNSKILVTGNTVIDSLFHCLKTIKNNKTDFIEKFEKILENKYVITVTAHRRENHGKGLVDICDSLLYLSKKYKNIHFVFPVHLNPKIKNIVYNKLDNILNISLINPLSYENFTWLMSVSRIILTDSGGIQEEAPSLGIPVLLLRNETERPEGIDAGTVKIIGNKFENITQSTSVLIENKDEYNRMSDAKNPYGDGTAVKKIINFLNENIKKI